MIKKPLFPLLITLLFILLPATVLAEGPLSGGTRIYIADEPLGPFTVTSFAAPNPPISTERLWVTVQVRDGAKAITDARVWVTVIPQKTGQPQRLEAVHELAAVPLDYTAALDTGTDGAYDVVIEMEHAQGNGEARYLVNVTEPLTNFIFLVMAAPALLIALALIHRFMIKLPAPVAVLAGDDDPLSADIIRIEEIDKK
ncbi:MAG: hypothetical protein ACPGWR_30955 [Ardenticatenaceae bacterium]